MAFRITSALVLAGLIAVGAFSSAFLGCLQAINVVKGRMGLAALTSVFIGTSQLTLFKLVPAVTHWWQGVLFVAAGVAGAQLSMAVKDHRLDGLWRWLRFGTITAKVTGTAGDSVPAEIEYRGRRGKLVGFWAYGSWDPGYPYRGQ